MTDKTESTTSPTKPRRRYRRWIAVIAATAIAILVASIFLGFWPLSLFILDPWDAIPKASPEEIAKLHQPDALRADLVDERWVARFPQPLGDRLKSLIENPDQ